MYIKGGAILLFRRVYNYFQDFCRKTRISPDLLRFAANIFRLLYFKVGKSIHIYTVKLKGQQMTNYILSVELDKLGEMTEILTNYLSFRSMTVTNIDPEMKTCIPVPSFAVSIWFFNNVDRDIRDLCLLFDMKLISVLN